MRDMSNKIRLNCHIRKDLGERLNEHCEKNELKKVYVIQRALEDYFMQEDIRQELAEKMKDPAVMAAMAKQFGIGVSGGSK